MIDMMFEGRKRRLDELNAEAERKAAERKAKRAASKAAKEEKEV